MADFNLKDDLLGFGRAQLKYMLFYNSTFEDLTLFTHRKGLFFYDTTTDTIEILHDNTDKWRTTLNIVSVNDPLYSSDDALNGKLLIGTSAYGTVKGFKPLTEGFLKSDLNGILSSQQYITFEDIEPTDYTTVISAPGLDTRFATEKAIVDYVASATFSAQDNILDWDGTKYLPFASKKGSNPGYAYFFSGTASYPSYNNVLNLDAYFRTANIQVRQGATQYSIIDPTYFSVTNTGYTTKVEVDTVEIQGRIYGTVISNSRSLPIRIGSKSIVGAENAESILIDDYNQLFNIDMTTVRLNKGTALKYLYLDANKNITYVDAPSGSNPLSVTDGIFNLDITGDNLTVSPFSTETSNAFYTSPIISIGADPPTEANVVLNFNGALRTTYLYEGTKRVMTEHGAQISDGTMHAVTDMFNAGFCPALPDTGGNTKYLRGDGTWQIITSGGTVNPLTVTDGILNLDITNDVLTVSPFLSKSTGTLYTGITVPDSVITTLNYDGIFRSTQLYEGNVRVMTTHGNWAANGSLHAVVTSSHAGFTPQLPLSGGSSLFLRGDGIWSSPVFTEADTLTTVSARGSVTPTILTYNESKVFTNPYSLITKEYADAVAVGISPKLPVDAATTANITLSGEQTIDGYSAVTSKRILVKNQSTQTNNGIYTVASGAWTREADSATWADLYKGYYVVLNGTVNGGSSYICTIASTGTLGADPVTYQLFSAPSVIIGGNGLTKTGSTLDVNVDNATIEIVTDTLKVVDNVFQPYDLDLVSIAGLSGTTGILKKTAANTWVLDTSTYITGTVVTSFNTRTGAVTLSKADVEAVLTGLITTHTHNYLPLSGGTISGNLTVTGTTTLNAVTKVGTTMITNFNADLLDGYHASDFSLYHTHPYLPLSGGTVTGNLVVNGTTTLNGITKIGTTMVTNLNADLLDGNHASAFALASHTHPYQPLDTDLTYIAALTGNGRLVRYVDNSWGLETTNFLTGTKVDSFNGRTGVVVLLKSDVEAVLTGLITSHTHNYDNYQNWLLKLNGTGVRYVVSTSSLNFQAGDGISMAFTSSTDTLLITNLDRFPGFDLTNDKAARGNHTHSTYVLKAGDTMTGALVAAANSTGSVTQVANVRYGTSGTMPTGTPNGTIYIRYTA